INNLPALNFRLDQFPNLSASLKDWIRYKGDLDFMKANRSLFPYIRTATLQQKDEQADEFISEIRADAEECLTNILDAKTKEARKSIAANGACAKPTRAAPKNA